MKNYMRYWRLIRYYYLKKYNITESELDLLLYVYSEKYFTVTDCQVFMQTFSWSKTRFSILKSKGFIDLHNHAHANSPAIWKITFKGKKLVASLYDKLEGGKISENYQFNRLFLKQAGYAHKTYKNAIRQMNEEIRTGKFKDD